VEHEVRGERGTVFIYTVSGFVRDGRVNGEGGIRYWAVHSGWVGVEGGGIKEACLVAVQLLCMFTFVSIFLQCI
jgi:hypothetical protein